MCAVYRLACWFQARLATNERSFQLEECIFGWDAGYRIEEDNCELKITMRIRLNPDADVTQAQIDERTNIWKTGIESIWSGQYLIERTDGECICEIYNVTVEVLWVDSNEHHTVDVRVGPDGSFSNLWDTADDEYTAAHEFGHLLGFVDEYYDIRCPDRDLSDDNSIMEVSGSGYGVKVRHYEPFARWVSLRTCCEYDVKT